jgi:hypothetical protein
LWFAEDADITKLTADEILKYTMTATAQEKTFLNEDETLFH